MKSPVVTICLLCLFAPALLAQSNVPSSMSYQGYATDLSGVPITDGNYKFTFTIYDRETAGSPVWTEIHPTVAVNKGFFHVYLGRGNPPNPLAIHFDDEYFLGIKVDTDPELTPRVRLTTSAYSFMSRMSERVSDPEVLTETELFAGAGINITNNSGTLTIAATGGTGALAGDVTGPANANVIAPNAVTLPKIAPDLVSSLDGVSNDGGDIDLVAGANVTITPNDAANTITIAATGGGGGLALPYKGTVSNNTVPAFKVTNTGTESAAEFYVSNTSANHPTVLANNTGTSSNAHSISSHASGGAALHATSSSSSIPVVDLQNQGDGPGVIVETKAGTTAKFTNTSTDPNTFLIDAKAGSTRSRVFSVRSSGIAVAKTLMNAPQHLSTGNLGSAGSPVPGYTYRDNIVYGWAKVSTNGSLLGGFGVAVTKTGTGTYNITYKTSMATMSTAVPTVTAYQTTGLDVAVISNSSASGCTVKIHNWDAGTKTFNLQDSVFFFQLCGRP